METIKILIEVSEGFVRNVSSSHLDIEVVVRDVDDLREDEFDRDPFHDLGFKGEELTPAAKELLGYPYDIY